jgi:hypothetical protein
MIASMIPIRFNNHKNVVNNTLETNETIITVDDKNDIKLNVENILFNFNYNSVLIKFNNELFVCEPISATEKRYSRRKVEYHPLMDKFN